MQNFAQVVDLRRADPPAVAHARNCGAADAVAVYQGIGTFSPLLHRSPEGRITYHILIVVYVYFLDNSHNYDYNRRKYTATGEY